MRSIVSKPPFFLKIIQFFLNSFPKTSMSCLYYIQEDYMKPCMYILQCKDNSYYVGSTTDLPRRIEEHKQGMGAEYTKYRLPVKLVYYEECLSIKDAFLREKQVQGWSHKKRQALINMKYESLKGLSKKEFKKKVR